MKEEKGRGEERNLLKVREEKEGWSRGKSR
jgi:hypothetical protein